MNKYDLYLAISALISVPSIGTFFYCSLRPERIKSTQLLPGLKESDLTSDTDHWGLY